MLRIDVFRSRWLVSWVLLLLVGRSGVIGAEASASLLRVGQRMLGADQSLRAQGWVPAPDRQPDELDRARDGTNLPSLSACTGSGIGYCRYDYRRGEARLSVITVPTSSGDQVLRWSDGATGRTWGLCPGSAADGLVPCGGR